MIGGRDLGELGKGERALDAVDRAVGRLAARVFVNEALVLHDEEREVRVERRAPAGVAGRHVQVVQGIEHAALHPAEGLDGSEGAEPLEKRRNGIPGDLGHECGLERGGVGRESGREQPERRRGGGQGQHHALPRRLGEIGRRELELKRLQRMRVSEIEDAEVFGAVGEADGDALFLAIIHRHANPQPAARAPVRRRRARPQRRGPLRLEPKRRPAEGGAERRCHGDGHASGCEPGGV